MQKNKLLILFLIAALPQFLNAALPQFLRVECAFASPFQQLYQRLSQTPVLAYVTVEKTIVHKPPQKDDNVISLSGDGSTTTASLTIHKVLKGVMTEQKIDLTYENNEGGTTVRYNIDLKKGDKKILFLQQDAEDKRWQISWGVPYFLNVNEKQEIELDSKTNVSFCDFSAGMSFLTKNGFSCQSLGETCLQSKKLSLLQAIAQNKTLTCLMLAWKKDREKYR